MTTVTLQEVIEDVLAEHGVRPDWGRRQKLAERLAEAIQEFSRETPS